MEIRPSSVRVGQTHTVPLRRQLSDLRRAVRQAIDTDADLPEALLQKLSDLEWLASLPRNLPPGSILNILV